MDPRSAYRTQLSDLNERIDHGGSLSGNERNCAFLNLGDRRRPRFATVSNAVGFDFSDDSRSLGVVDWDQDGDLDVWLMNRTAPRVRLLRNDQAAGHHFVSIRLRGQTCNRDAIGARVDVVCDGSPPLTKTLRAGEGFLSQSSKWMHFGLGAASKIQTLTVRWPGGETQEFADLLVDRFYSFQQGKADAQPLDAHRTYKPWNPGSLESGELATQQAAVLLSSRIAVPRLPYRTASGDSAAIDDLRGQPVFLNLWASWCLPCRRELSDLVEHIGDFKRKQVQIVALSTDGLSDQAQDVDPTHEVKRADEAVESIINRLQRTIRSGHATPVLVNRLQFLDDYLFSQKRELSIPTSFLIDGDGRLVAVYRGAVDVQTVLSHVDKLSLKGKAIFDAALPFPGRWYQPNEAIVPLSLVVFMDRRGQLDDAAHYLREQRQPLARQAGYVTLVGRVASKLAAQQRQSDAIALYRDALEVAPQNVALINNLAWHLATHSNPDERRPAEAIQLAERAAKLSDYGIANVIDTLIAAHLSADRRGDAIIACRRAIRLARQKNRRELVEQLSERLKRLEQSPRE